MFTFEEMVAANHLLIALAECDGPKNYEENHCLTKCSLKLGIDISELSRVIFAAATVSTDSSYITLSKMSVEKKTIFEECLLAIMQADGEPNNTEYNNWIFIEQTLQLPKWIYLNKTK